MKHTNALYNEIERGLKGQNIGVSTGLLKLDEVIAGIQKKTIYNIAAGQGAGNICRSDLEKSESLTGKIGEVCNDNTEIIK